MAESESVNRVVRLLLAGMYEQKKSKWQPTERYIELRRLAYQCAAFGNELLNESYAKAKGWDASGTYTDYSDKLSAAVRDAVGRECVGIWRRNGKLMLRGEQTLARFSANRALVVRDRGIKIERKGQTFAVTLRLLPQGAGAVTEVEMFEKQFDRNPRLRPLLDKIAAGVYPAVKATIQFRNRKVYLLIAYEKPAAELNDEAGIAVVWLRDGRTEIATVKASLNLSHFVYQIVRMKEQFAGVHQRLRQTWNRRGSRRKRKFREAMAKAGSFEGWCDTPMHELSRKMVQWCVGQKVATISWNVDHDGGFPHDRLRFLVEYKAREVGIEFSKTSGAQEQKPGLRQKQHRKAKKALNLSRAEERLQ